MIELTGLAPSPGSFNNLAWQLAAIRRCEEGIDFGEQSIERWPGERPAYAYLMLGIAYICSNRPGAALEVLRKGVMSNPTMALPQNYLIILELLLGEPLTNPGAFEAYIDITEIPTMIAIYAYATALHGDKEKARAAIARFEALENSGAAIGFFDQTIVALAHGNREQAREWLQRTIELIDNQQPDVGSAGLSWIVGNVLRDSMLDEPEFVALRKQLRGR